MTDPRGRDLGAETPIPSLPLHQWHTLGTVVRSRVDPNGVLFTAAGWGTGTDSRQALMAFRPVPLAPSWLAISAWSGTVDPWGSVPIALTFHAGDRAPGEYRSMLVVEDTTGAVLASVPLTLAVEADTPAEPAPAEVDISLTVAPNPAHGAVAVNVSLARRSSARISVHDLLGREVAVLHAGPLAAGTHRLPWDAGDLAPGLYLVRAVADGHTASLRGAVAGR